MNAETLGCDSDYGPSTRQVSVVSTGNIKSSAYQVTSATPESCGFMSVHRENGPGDATTSLGEFVVLYLSLQTGLDKTERKYHEIEVRVVAGDADKLSLLWDAIWSQIILPTPQVHEWQVVDYLNVFERPYGVSTLQDFKNGFCRCRSMLESRVHLKQLGTKRQWKRECI